MIMIVTMERTRTREATEPNSGVVALEVEFWASKVPLSVRLPPNKVLRSLAGSPSDEFKSVELSLGNPKPVELSLGKAPKSVELSAGPTSVRLPRSALFPRSELFPRSGDCAYTTSLTNGDNVKLVFLKL